MAQDAISGLDRFSVQSTRTYPKFSAFGLEDCFRSVVVKGTLSIRVEYLCRSKLRPVPMICIQDTGNSLLWYLTP
eukprot:4817935-Pyramimonas_sp.AAC.1